MGGRADWTAARASDRQDREHLGVPFNTLLLGVTAAIDPALIGAVAFMLTRRRPERLLAVYLVGGFGISMIAGAVVLFVFKDVGANKTSSVPPGIEIAVGAVLVVCAVL